MSLRKCQEKEEEEEEKYQERRRRRRRGIVARRRKPHRSVVHSRTMRLRASATDCEVERM